jgi:hypothetical protein
MPSSSSSLCVLGRREWREVSPRLGFPGVYWRWPWYFWLGEKVLAQRHRICWWKAEPRGPNRDIILTSRTPTPVFASCPLGTPQRRGPDTVPGQKALLWRVQVSQVQEKMDERELVGQHGAGVHQMPHQRVPAQAGGWGLWVEWSHRAGVGSGRSSGRVFLCKPTVGWLCPFLSLI